MLCLTTRGCYFLLPCSSTKSTQEVFLGLIVSSTPSKLPVLSRCENMFERNKSCPARPTGLPNSKGLSSVICHASGKNMVYGHIWTPNSIFTVNNDDNPLEAGYLIFINQIRIVNNGIQIDVQTTTFCCPGDFWLMFRKNSQPCNLRHGQVTDVQRA